MKTTVSGLGPNWARTSRAEEKGGSKDGTERSGGLCRDQVWYKTDLLYLLFFIFFEAFVFFA
ncbi:hypothetical protein GCM10027085_11870 [Spirosoma aerophilum]